MIESAFTMSETIRIMPARSFCFIAESKCGLDSRQACCYTKRFIQKESVGIMLVTRPTHRGSGIALIVETSNAEAHADMYINEYDASNRQGLPAYKIGYNIPMDIYRCFEFDYHSKLPDSYVSRTKRQVNAFTFCQSSIPSHSPLHTLYRVFKPGVSTFPCATL